MYNEIKNITKTFQERLGVVKDENGKTLTEAGEMLDRSKAVADIWGPEGRSHPLQ